MKINSISQFLLDKFEDKPMSIHLDLIGLLRLGKNNKERLENFREILLSVEDKGGTILIPTYSMSYTKNEFYNIKNSSSEVGIVTEFLKDKDYNKRTYDPLFSYLIYSKKEYNQFYKVNNFNCFGENSLIEMLYNNNGFLSTIGCGMRMLTEIYFLENKFGINYRYNKTFKGTTLTTEGEEINTEVTYFCRDIEKYPNLLSNFITLENDLIKNNIVEKWNYDNIFSINSVSFKKIENFILRKIKEDPFYLTIDKNIKNKWDQI
ncbi:MAG: AAC(3) family N-acetyltransferase [Campylobacterota bacterium]|nr:AAC(3) family N-acetyltransferase [Campylobacterota bacterium]